MQIVEELPVSATQERQVQTPDSWPEGVSHNGMDLSKALDQIRSIHFDRRMELMQQNGPEFAKINAIERRLSLLTYASQPFTNLQVAKHIAEDLQQLRDLYGEGNVLGRAMRGVQRSVSGLFAKTAEAQPDVACP